MLCDRRFTDISALVAHIQVMVINSEVYEFQMILAFRAHLHWHSVDIYTGRDRLRQ